MNIALYGGTFDPIHKGHLEVARAAADTFDLERVLLIPVGVPPHRGGRPEAPYRDRYRMVELACEADTRFEASDLEAERKDGRPNYSIDTIQRVTPDLAAGDRLFFVIGCDAFGDIQTWHRWEEVVRGTEWIVVSRPGSECDEERVPGGARVHWLRDVAVHRFLRPSCGEDSEKMRESRTGCPQTSASSSAAAGCMRPSVTDRLYPDAPGFMDGRSTA